MQTELTPAAAGRRTGIFAGAVCVIGAVVLIHCGPNSGTAPPAPRVRVVSIAPAHLGVTVGTRVHLEASARDLVGSALPCSSPVWRSSAVAVAQVTPAGEVVGMGDGDATITATCDGVSGTSLVSSAALPPASYTLITERAFESKAAEREDSVGAEGWEASEEFAAPLFSIVVDSTAPRSSPHVGQMRYPPGFTGGAQPAIIDKTIRGNFTRIYIGLWVKLSANWVGHPAFVNKILFMWIGGKPKLILSADGSGTGRLWPSIRVQDGPDHTDARPPNMVTGAEIVRGRWQHWEIMIYDNTPGLADGRVRWWVDGLLVSDWADVALLAPGEDPRWQIFQWAPTWGGVGNVLTAEQFMWWDHVIVSGRE